MGCNVMESVQYQLGFMIDHNYDFYCYTYAADGEQAENNAVNLRNLVFDQISGRSFPSNE